MSKAEKARASGCWFGQLVGDALGTLVEGQSAAEIARAFPKGVRDLHDGGAFDLLAGQPTDDTELALSLSWSLLDEADYVEESAASHYVRWFDTEPFGVSPAVEVAVRAAQQASLAGEAVALAMRAAADATSLQPAPLMRVAPIAIFGVHRGDEWVAQAAMQDAALTHAYPVVQQASAVFAVTLARAIRGETDARALLTAAREHALRLEAHAALQDALRDAEHAPPTDFTDPHGVCVALQNAFHVLLQGLSFDDALAGTLSHGGDTNANGVIAGALLGAVHGMHAIPARFRECVDACEPDEDDDDVSRPRPSWLWPTGAEGLALSLLDTGAAG